MQEQETIRERVILVMKHYNLDLTEFSKAIECRASTISHILTDRNRVSINVVINILKRFPEISADWLLLGRGRMLKVDNTIEEVIEKK